MEITYDYDLDKRTVEITKKILEKNDEFNFDSAYSSLSQLSSEDRGLVDKKPAERKKLVNNEITSLILYSNNLDQKDIATNMNKKLNLGKKINDKLPILIKYRNGEILESIPNITSENLVAECNK